MWIRTLKLENFQSHKETILNLHPHFNCLVGTGNSGKTSIVRALSFVLFGQWSPSWIRHGAKLCRITLLLDNGLEVVREKGDKVNRYVVTQNGKSQVYENFGVHVPEEIQKQIGIFKAVVGDKEEINLNLSSQLEPLFLLSNPGAFKAKVIGKLSKAHYLDHALREINKDKKRLSSEKQLIEKEVEMLDIQLRGFINLDTKKLSLEQIGNSLHAVSIKQIRLEQLRMLQQKMQTWKKTYLDVKKVSDQLTTVSSVSFGSLDAKALKVKTLKEIKNRIATWKSNHENLTKLLQSSTREKNAVTQTYIALLKSSKKCPTCFTELTDAALMTVQKEL